MFQLKYDETLKNITRDIPFWKEESDISAEIKSFIINKQEDTIIHDIESDKCYCFNCMNELDENYYCNNCKETKANSKVEYLEKYSDKNLEYSYNEDYFAFDILNNNVFLYEIGLISTVFHNPFLKKTIKNYRFNINRAYLIEKTSFKNLRNNQTFSYKEYYETVYKHNNNNEIENLDIYVAEVYTKNLDELKNTIYKYSYIWLAKEYFESNYLISLENLIFLPLYFKNFDLLMKEKLLALAFTTYDIPEKAKTFEEIYNIDKKYIPFIRKYDMSYQEVKLLQIYQKEDIETIKYYTDNYYIREKILSLLKKYKIDLKYLKDYITSQSTNEEDILTEYFDYLKMADELQLNLKDKKVLYPDNLIREHNKLFLEMKIIEDPDINKKIKEIGNALSLNKYENDKYIIFPAKSIEDLIEESENQHNCVRGYANEMAKNKSQIYFLREKANPTKSLITVEVCNNKVIQAKAKYNKTPEQEQLDFLNKWEKTLISVNKKENYYK